eukprot:363682-Chlamydomonas_euryale.AAC.11
MWSLRLGPGREDRDRRGCEGGAGTRGQGQAGLRVGPGRKGSNMRMLKVGLACQDALTCK